MTASTVADVRRPGFRSDVEGMRAVAVGLVIAYHAGWGVVSGGFVGVDVFFVLSGFLITGLLSDELCRTGKIDFLRFYARRVRRLLPVSAVVLASTAVVFAVVISPLDRSSLFGDVTSAAMYVANWHFAHGQLDYLHDPSKSPVLHFWSLSVEEQFYLSWPLLLVAALGWRRGAAKHRDPRRRLVVALGLVAAASLLASIWLTRGEPAYSYYGLHTRAWELAAGGLLALAAHQVRRLPYAVRGLAALAGLVIVLVSATVIDTSTPFPGSAALFPVLGTVLMIAGGGPDARAGVSALLAVRPLTYIGRISYSWYLWHWPCLVYVRVRAGGSITASDVDGTDAGHVPVTATLLAVIASFVLAVASHHLFEDPLRRSRWLGAARRRSLALGAALTATTVAVAAAALPQVSTVASSPVRALVATGAGHAPEVRLVRLRSSPASARLDRPSDVGGCYNSGLGSSYAPPTCAFGDVTAGRTIALVGDSHAEMWFPALDRYGRLHHWRVLMWSKALCPFIELTVSPAATGPNAPCNSWRAAVLGRLTAAQPDVVVVAHARGYLGLVARGDGTKEPPAQGALRWGSAWRQTARELRGVTPHVVLVRDTPTPRLDVPGCLAEHSNDVRRCSFPRASAFKRDGLYGAEREVSMAGVSTVDMDGLLCADDPCPVVWRDGTIMYRDSHHLTASMSRALAVAFGRKLLAAAGS